MTVHSYFFCLGSHTAENIGQIVTKLLTSYQIHHLTKSATSDQGANYVKAIRDEVSSGNRIIYPKLTASDVL
jgi:hypothetical protein